MEKSGLQGAAAALGGAEQQEQCLAGLKLLDS